LFGLKRTLFQIHNYEQKIRNPSENSEEPLVPSEPRARLFYFLERKKILPHHAAAEQSHTENKNEVTGTVSVPFLRLIALQFVSPEDKDSPGYYRDRKKKKKRPASIGTQSNEKNADGSSQEIHPKNPKPGTQEHLHMIQQRIHTNEKCLHPNTTKPLLINK
jgi:hypothetical protein